MAHLNHLFILLSLKANSIGGYLKIYPLFYPQIMHFYLTATGNYVIGYFF